MPLSPHLPESKKPEPFFFWGGGSGLGVEGSSVQGFRGLGFRGLGFRGLGFRVCCAAELFKP